LIPVAFEAATQLGANTLSFLFAASTAFMTPVGYQTNRFVYAPGGYAFGDFFRLGMPTQLSLSVATTAGVAVFWGV